jgi:hypothetical protein
VNPIEVESESLRRAARVLTGVAEDTDGTLQGFLTQAQALGEPWGDDDLGSAIGAVYQAALAMVMNCFTSNLDTMDGYGERLGVAADNYDGTDSEAARGLTQVGHGHPELAI